MRPKKSCKITQNNKMKKLTPYLFITPWLFGFFAFTLGPLLFSLYISFYDWPLVGTPKFIGIENYRYMLSQDIDFWDSFVITAKFAAMYVPLTLCLALLLALLLNQKVKGQGVFRTIFYLPSIISGVALVGIFSAMYNYQYGILNYLLSLLGITPINWLGSPDWAIWSILFACLWSVGGTMLIFLAGLKNIPKELYEAASLSGASGLSQFIHITLPLLSPVILFNVVTSVIAAFQQLTLALLLTNGGPVNSTHFLAIYIYNTAFKYFDMGYASSMSWLMFIFILFLTASVMRFSNAFIFYESVADKSARSKTAKKK
jgi:multiple sugar transport system permease protein